MQHAILAARGMISANSSEHERATLLGYVGVAFGIGFAIGPAAGGQLSRLSLQTAAWTAAVGSVLGMVGVTLLLPSGVCKATQQAVVCVV